MDQLDEFATFDDIGFHKPPDCFEKILVHIILDVKHRGRHNWCLKANSQRLQMKVYTWSCFIMWSEVTTFYCRFKWSRNLEYQCRKFLGKTKSFINELKTNHKFKLKGTSVIKYHLGCDFLHDEDCIFCMTLSK